MLYLLFWPLFKGFLKLGQKYNNIFVGFLVQMETLKFAFEINWPLQLNQTGNLIFIVQGISPRKLSNNELIRQIEFYLLSSYKNWWIKIEITKCLWTHMYQTNMGRLFVHTSSSKKRLLGTSTMAQQTCQKAGP